MTRKVLILDGSIWAEMYGPTMQWRRLLGQIPADSVHLPSGGKVPDLDGYTHLVITGSEASIVRPEPWYEDEVSAVRRAFELGMPILGSCFGHQMLALALSGRDHVRASGTPEMGWIPVEMTGQDELFEGVTSPSWMFASHFDEVCDLPPQWKVLARSAGCAVQAMRWQGRPVWGLQAHPEIPPGEGKALLEGFARKVPAAEPMILAALAAEPRDDGAGAIIVRNFLLVG